MLLQRTSEERRIWKALSGDKTLSYNRLPSDIAEEIQLVKHAMQREFWRMTWWRYLLAAFMSISGCILLIGNLREILAGEFNGSYWLLINKIFVMTVSAFFLLFHIKPSGRWVNGVMILIELSKQAAAEDSVRALLYVARLDAFCIHLGQRLIAPTLYERLAQVLTRLTHFRPTDGELDVLQRIALSSKQYPDTLRVAALLILGDHPEQLGQRFRTRLQRVQRKEGNEVFLAAAREVLSRTA